MAGVFVSVGTHNQQFNRLLEEIDRLVGEGLLKDSVFAQTGNSSYKPKNFPFKKFITGKKYTQEFEKAKIVVSHGGAGTIINALEKQKPLIIVPRQKQFGEHTNNHQLDLAKALEAEGKAIAVVDEKQLKNALEKAKNFKPKIASNRAQLVQRIDDFLKGMENELG